MAMDSAQKKQRPGLTFATPNATVASSLGSASAMRMSGFFKAAAVVAAMGTAAPVMAAVPCANRTELEAIQIRHLQSRLMVAALSCNQQKAYNDFVTAFQPELTAHGTQLVAYFNRTK